MALKSISKKKAITLILLFSFFWVFSAKKQRQEIGGLPKYDIRRLVPTITWEKRPEKSQLQENKNKKTSKFALLKDAILFVVLAYIFVPWILIFLFHSAAYQVTAKKFSFLEMTKEGVEFAMEKWEFKTLTKTYNFVKDLFSDKKDLSNEDFKAIPV